jgi:hypothetical protein
MTNEVKINLTENDIKTAILDYVKKAYPTFSDDKMYIAYNAHNCEGYVKGKIKEGN